MSTELNHQEIEELLGAYALDAVDPDEVAAVERHLVDCPRCRAAVDAARELAGSLGTAAAAADGDVAPPELWGGIAGSPAGPARGPAPRWRSASIHTRRPCSRPTRRRRS